MGLLAGYLLGYGIFHFWVRLVHLIYSICIRICASLFAVCWMSVYSLFLFLSFFLSIIFPWFSSRIRLLPISLFAVFLFFIYSSGNFFNYSLKWYPIHVPGPSWCWNMGPSLFSQVILPHVNPMVGLLEPDNLKWTSKNEKKKNITATSPNSPSTTSPKPQPQDPSPNPQPQSPSQPTVYTPRPHPRDKSPLHDWMSP